MSEEKLPEASAITLRNVKQHRELRVDLSGRMIVLVGPNGVGKSTVLKAIRSVGMLDGDGEHGLQHAARVARTLAGRGLADRLAAEAVIKSWRGPLPGAASIDLTFPSGELHFELGLELNDTALLTPQGGRLPRLDAELFDKRTRDPHVRAMRSAYLQPEFSALARPSRVESTMLGERGENLATVIAQFALRFRKEHQSVLDSIKRVVPEIAFVGALTKSEQEAGSWNSAIVPYQAFELEFEFSNGAKLRGADVSEGTLISLAILSLTHHSPGVRYVLLDDVDRALHPIAQRILVAQLRAVLDARPDLKIICSSHSPYLVEHFDASEVRVLGRSAKTGDTVCKRLDQHPEWPRYKQYLDAGSYWASVGEDWVGEG